MNSERASTTILAIFIASAITTGVIFVDSFNQAKSFSKRHEFQMPRQVKAVYLSAWSVSRESQIEYIKDLAKETEINTVVIDIKDWSGNIFYNTDVSKFEEYNAEKNILKDVDSLIKELHKEDIGVIARIVVFQDPVLAKAKPNLAIKTKDGKIWKTSNGLAWIDPTSKEAWNYNLKLAKDAFRKGFDEVNFDYIRFPSDGNLKNTKYPVWNKEKRREKVIGSFFKYTRRQLPGKRLSVDLFGLSAVGRNDLGIGQIIEDAFRYFDYVCPMVYPSHFSKGSFGYKNPGKNPYEVVFESVKSAKLRLKELEEKEAVDSKLRPWLQDFDLGTTTYTSEMVKEQIEATSKALGEDFSGFMLWNSGNIYTKKALE